MKKSFKIKKSVLESMVDDAIRSMLKEVATPGSYEDAMEKERKFNYDELSQDVMHWALNYADSGHNQPINALQYMHEWYLGDENTLDMVCDKFAEWKGIENDENVRNAVEKAANTIGYYNNWNEDRIEFDESVNPGVYDAPRPEKSGRDESEKEKHVRSEIRKLRNEIEDASDSEAEEIRKRIQSLKKSIGITEDEQKQAKAIEDLKRQVKSVSQKVSKVSDTADEELPELTRNLDTLKNKLASMNEGAEMYDDFEEWLMDNHGMDLQDWDALPDEEKDSYYEEWNDSVSFAADNMRDWQRDEMMFESFKSQKLKNFARQHGGLKYGDWSRSFENDLYNMSDADFDAYEVVDQDEHYRKYGLNGTDAAGYTNNNFQPIEFGDGTFMVKKNPQFGWHDRSDNVRFKAYDRWKTKKNDGKDEYQFENPYLKKKFNDTDSMGIKPRGKWGIPGEGDLTPDNMNMKALRQMAVSDEKGITADTVKPGTVADRARASRKQSVSESKLDSAISKTIKKVLNEGAYGYPDGIDSIILLSENDRELYDEYRQIAKACMKLYKKNVELSLERLAESSIMKRYQQHCFRKYAREQQGLDRMKSPAQFRRYIAEKIVNEVVNGAWDDREINESDIWNLGGYRSKYEIEKQEAMNFGKKILDGEFDERLYDYDWVYRKLSHMSEENAQYIIGCIENRIKMCQKYVVKEETEKITNVWVDSRVPGIGKSWYYGENEEMNLDDLQSLLDKYDASVLYKSNLYDNVYDIPLKSDWHGLSKYGMPDELGRGFEGQPTVTIVPKGTKYVKDYFGKRFEFPEGWNEKSHIEKYGVKKPESRLREEIEEPKQYGYQNVDDAFVEKHGENGYEVWVPEWALCYIINGDTECMDDEDIAKIDKFIETYQDKVYPSVDACCMPMDGEEPSFRYKNSIDNLGADCYRFFLPAK